MRKCGNIIQLIALLSILPNSSIAPNSSSAPHFTTAWLIPFVSDVDPKFPRLIRVSFKEQFRQFPISGRYVYHKFTIAFSNCKTSYKWQPDESIIIRSNNIDHPWYVNTILQQQKKTATPCRLVHHIKIWYNLNGYPLKIIHQRNNRQQLEQSYHITFRFTDLQMNLDKYIYSHHDRIIVRCALISPTFTPQNDTIKIRSSDRYLSLSQWRLGSSEFVLEMVGDITERVTTLNFSCSYLSLVISQSALLQDARSAVESLSVVNHGALAACLSMLLVVLIVIGIYFTIIGPQRKLAFDMTSHYVELVEDRTDRFGDPILNNVTSPIRKYSLPGLITAFRLRRNFPYLCRRLLPTVRLAEEEEEEEEDEPRGSDIVGDPPPPWSSEGERLVDEFGQSMKASSMEDKGVIGIGTRPTERVKGETETVVSESIKSMKSPKSTPLSTSTQDLPSRKVDSAMSLDPHAVGSLPYVRIVRNKMRPYWYIVDGEVPVSGGVLSRELTNG